MPKYQLLNKPSSRISWIATFDDPTLPQIETAPKGAVF